MASISLLSFPISNCSYPSMFPRPPKQRHPSKHKKPTHHHVSIVACNSNPHKNPTTNSSEEEKSENIVGNRRDFLVGLGGLCGAATLTSGNNKLAIAAPVPPPNLETCGQSYHSCESDPPIDVGPIMWNTECCPPKPSTIIDFEFPSPTTPFRIRKPAHSVTRDYLEKYEEAVRRMKALPLEDPRSFKQQANVHCAYCEGFYDQLGFPGVKLQVHCSWLFFPFHSWYLYFHERILGKLIGDPTFALPFWNWDHPDGMKMPSIYSNDENSPLYDPFRESLHQPPTLVDLDYNQSHDPQQDLICNNLFTMYRQVVSLGRLPSLFLGSPYRAGGQPNTGAGSLEQKPHNTVHNWTGDSKQSDKKDMGNFHTAGRDPIFFAHHSNVDRMWNIWKTTVPGGQRRDFIDPDWLESSFLFYDENANLVRVKVKDCLDTTRLGYTFHEVDIPWLKFRPKPKKLLTPQKAVQPPAFPQEETVKFPFTLDSTTRIFVKRPLQIAHEAEEVLVIDIDCADSIGGQKFDVYINDQGDDNIKVNHAEFAGSFVSLPHFHKGVTNIDCCPLRLGITDLLKDLKAQNDDRILVTLVPKYGSHAVITGIKVELVVE